jgi:transaldolase/glucose-6-phosphate isomerase
MTPLKALQEYGQSFWLDYMRRSLITGGELERLVKEDGLRGVSSNLTIFQKVIAGSPDYDEDLRKQIRSDRYKQPREVYEELAFEDIRVAADILQSVYKETEGADGFVCVELAPDLTHDTHRSINEGRRIWKALSRPNIMVKIPATPEGIQAVETLISEGINVNVNLMFSLSHYDAATAAYIKGVEKCSTPAKVASVVSFSLSRMDRAVNKTLEELGTAEALALRDKIAIASAKMVYQRFREIFSAEKWNKLDNKGARVQRLLWTCTGANNPACSDVLYAEELIGPQTVISMAPATLNAFRDHGRVQSTLEEGLKEAEASIEKLSSLGVDFNLIAEKLQIDGVAASAGSFAELLETLKEKCHALLHGFKERQVLELGEYNAQIERRLKLWEGQSFIRRLWAKDYTIWFSEPRPEIVDRLGWLALPEVMQERLDDFNNFAARVKDEGISHVVLLGMGGSSLAPEVFQKAFGNQPGYPELLVLDSTHPTSVRAMEEKLDLSRTIFLISSKSGTTLETLSLFRYFWSRVRLQSGQAGHHFVAITDPDSPLKKIAQEREFRKVFEASADVGGRYSALTDFGLLPGALIGMDIHSLLDKAWVASENSAFCVSEQEASGLILGAALGELAKDRNKVTILASESLRHFPHWVEQLIAESTGKDEKGILPVIGEPLISPEEYGEDRLFIYFFLEGEKSRELEAYLSSLQKAGQPMIRVNLAQKYDLGFELFRWEMAVASAGSVLGIHPFNQPDVQLTKELTRKSIMEESEKESETDFRQETLSLREPEVFTKALKMWIAQVRSGDYIALQAYLSPLPEATAVLQSIRQKLLKLTGLATTLGYGPRFLHSTGQLHKGGPNNGLFLQIVDEPGQDIPIPETEYTFRGLIQAQALGDYHALLRRGRRILRINVGEDAIGGCRQLRSLIKDL